MPERYDAAACVTELSAKSAILSVTWLDPGGLSFSAPVVPRGPIPGFNYYLMGCVLIAGPCGTERLSAHGPPHSGVNIVKVERVDLRTGGG